jgi:hypothetical protein
MPTIPSPPASNTPQSHQKVSNGSRSSAAGGSGSRGLRPQQYGASNGLKHSSKGRGGAEDSGHRAPRPASSAATRDGPREKAPSKDGTVQRTAKEVEGLKDFVREHLPRTLSTRASARRGIGDLRENCLSLSRENCSMTRSREDLSSQAL